VDDAALDELAQREVIRPETLVWHEGMSGWAAYSTLRVAQPPPLPEPGFPGQPPLTRACAECGRPYPLEELVVIGWMPVCAVCKPIYVQRLREGGQTTATRRFAGFWVRFVARRIDAVVIGVFIWIVARSMGSFSVTANIGLTALVWLIQIVLGMIYEVFFVWQRGATPGKVALGLRVVRADGARVSLGLSFGRFFADWLSQLTMGIGYIMAAFDEEKRALHDRICETRVVYSK
jgi:uncharacterized RDD family membrane protein YckC